MSPAYRLRGWADESVGLEQRLKDLETFDRALRRRWWIIATGAVIAFIGRAAGAVPTASGTITIVAMAALALNGGLGLGSEKGGDPGWLNYRAAVADALLMA